MDLGNLDRFKNKQQKQAKNKIYSAAHLLAKELMDRLGDKNFGLYLGLASRYPEPYLRRILDNTLSAKNLQTPYKLFLYLIKKENGNKQ
jgi:hypothetical protein